MKSAADLLAIRKPRARLAPHPQAAAVNEIIAFLGDANKASYGRWLRLVKSVSFGDVMALVNKARGLDPKYNRAGFLVNRLKEMNRVAVLSRPARSTAGIAESD